MPRVEERANATMQWHRMNQFDYSKFKRADSILTNKSELPSASSTAGTQTRTFIPFHLRKTLQSFDDYLLFVRSERGKRTSLISYSGIKSLRPPQYAQHHKPQPPPYSSLVFTLHPESERVDKWGEGVQGLSPLRTVPRDLWWRSRRLHDD